jgi:hypothetical protein
MLQYPLFVSVSSFITFVWEMTFIITIWVPRLRWWVLAIGTIFHIMTVFTLGLIIFPLVVIASYMVFLNEADTRAICGWSAVRRFFPRAAVPEIGPAVEQTLAAWRGQLGSIGAFALTIAVISVAGVEAEYLTDRYQMRGPDGPLALREMTEEEVAPLFAPDRPIRQIDKLLAFDLGNRLVGEHLLHCKNEFRHGEQLVAQVTLNKPREDMWVDCLLCEANLTETDGQERLVPGRIVTKVGQAIYRETFRGNFVFMIDEALDPGDYFLRLRSGNEEVSRRHFTILPRSGAAAPVAN